MPGVIFEEPLSLPREVTLPEHGPESVIGKKHGSLADISKQWASGGIPQTAKFDLR
jgi:hypothetical protein